MNPNDTPETDSNSFNAEAIAVNLPPADHKFCHAFFARKLERERNANQAMIDKLQKELTAALEVVAKLEREKQ